jgi:diguanylate cyclase (GGDEF)-like protein/PAS domain S-box-containing protein
MIPGRAVGLATLGPREGDGGRTTLDALRQRLDLEDVLSRTATTFIHRPAHEVLDAIAETLADIGRFADVERAFLYLLNERREAAELSHEWVAPGVPPSRSADRAIPLCELPRWLEALEREEAVYIPRVSDLGDEWTAERQRLDRYGCRSVLAVPVTDTGRTRGFLGFDLVTTDRIWSDDHIVVLESTAGIIAQALARSDAEQRFGLAFDHAPLGMALHGPNGHHIQVNPAYCRLMGRREDELLGQSVLDLIEPEDRHLLQGTRPGLVSGERNSAVVELRFRRPDGTAVWGRVHIAGVRTPDGSLYYTVSHVEDITARVERDTALRASEQRYRTLVENLPSLIFRYDRNLNPVFVSPSVERLPGMDPADPSVATVDFRGRHDSDRWAQYLRRVIETGQRSDAEFELYTGGKSYWYQTRAVPEYDDRGDVAHVLVVSSEITALKRTEAQLAHQALHDPLTGLANRALLVDFLDRSLNRRRDHGSGLGLLFIDLDRFKWVNDSLGHRAGDELLKAVAHRLTSTVRPSDLIARLGGDEFVVVIDGVVDPREPVRVARRIQGELSTPMVIEGTEVVATASIGIAMTTSANSDADGLLRDADSAMYLAKANGRNRFEIFDAVLRTQAQEKLRMESALRRAIDEGGIEVFYQPELDLDSGEIVGFEALARWNHPTEGRLAAVAFIELAEETGLIIDLGESVLRQACIQAGRWRRDRPGRPVKLRVNLSGRQFAQVDLVQQVVRALSAGDLEPSNLCLEITETALMADPGRGLAVLEHLRGLGIELAIDDFGTGYSSLAYLKRLPVDVLKIDRSFVNGLGDDPDDTAIATAIISLARSLGMRVVAEGVETRRQLDELRRLGCDRAQGYLFARPSPPAEAWGVASPYPVAEG